MPSKILIIDDDAGVAAALVIRLRAAGYEVLTANDGRSGLVAARDEAPDLILLDVRMPGLDGFQVHQHLREDVVMASIPVVFLSANLRESIKQRALRAGAAAFLSKPYEPGEMLSVVQACLAGHTQPHLEPEHG